MAGGCRVLVLALVLVLVLVLAPAGQTQAALERPPAVAQPPEEAGLHGRDARFELADPPPHLAAQRRQVPLVAVDRAAQRLAQRGVRGGKAGVIVRQPGMLGRQALARLVVEKEPQPGGAQPRPFDAALVQRPDPAVRAAGTTR